MVIPHALNDAAFEIRRAPNLVSADGIEMEGAVSRAGNRMPPSRGCVGGLENSGECPGCARVRRVFRSGRLAVDPLSAAAVDRDRARLERLGNLPRQVDMEQPLVESRAGYPDAIGEVEAPLEPAGRDPAAKAAAAALKARRRGR